MHIPRFIPILLVALLFPVSETTAEPGDESWSSAYHPPGLDGSLHSLTSTPEGLYVCGSIIGLGGTDARGIALVTDAGASWDVQGFGDDLLETWGKPVRFEGRLTVSGKKVTEAGDPLYGAYAFDGSRWSRLGTDPPFSRDLAVYQGRLFSLSFLYPEAESTLWELAGDTWLPRLVIDGYAAHVIEHGGLLYVAGDFASVDGDSVANIFAWDGVDILDLGWEIPHPVTALISYDGDLVVSGAGDGNGGIISRWNGSNWTTLMDRNRLIDSLAILGGNLVAATDSFYAVPWSTVHDRNIMMYENGQWGPLTTAGGLQIGALGDALFLQNTDRNGIAEGGLVAPGLVVWRDGALEAPFPSGMGFPDASLNLSMFQEDLLVGGEFRYGAGVNMEGAGTYDGVSWTAVDTFDPGLSLYPEPLGFQDVTAVGDDLFGIYLIWQVDVRLSTLVKRDGDPANMGVWRPLPGDPGDFHPYARLQAAGDRLFTLVTRVIREIHEVDTETGAQFALAPLELDGPILASCEIDSRLVIAGDFTTLNGSPSSNILRYEDTHWSDAAPALPGPVTAVATLPEGRLAAAYQAGSAHRVAVFDGATWIYHRGDFDGPVQALAWHQDRLVAAGYFSYVDDLEASGIAVWTGGTWARVGSGLEGWPSYEPGIVDLVSTDHGLYVSGNMTTAGGHRTRGLAQWTGDLRLISGLSPVADDIPAPAAPFRLRAYPNPFNPRSVISWDLPDAGLVDLAVFDLQGRRVRTLVTGHRPAGPDEAVWDGTLDAGRPAPSGVYHLRLEVNGVSGSRKLTLVR